MAEHGCYKTICNLSLTQSQSKPRKQPLQLLEVSWRHHPRRNLISDFSWSGAFSSPIPAGRAGLAIIVSKKDYGFDGHWPSLLALVSCSKQERSSMWSTRRWGSGRTFGLLLWFGIKSLCGLRNWGACRRGTGTLSSHLHKKLTSIMRELKSKYF